MSPKRKRAIWPADPHTLAKIELVRRYLDAWLPIMGSKFAKRPILYIDGFAGPGIYAGGEDGSPITALKSASNALLQAGKNWLAGDVHIAAVEKEKDFAQSLRDQISLTEHHPRVHVSVREGAFDEQLHEIKAAYPFAFRDRNHLFAFIDPFGPTHVPFQAVKEVLSSATSEVLINLDADGIERIKRYQVAGNIAALDRIFGDHEWVDQLDDSSNFKESCRNILRIYRERLYRLRNVDYTFALEMRDKQDKHSYYLLFATGHRTGMERMKGAMRSVGHEGAFEFSDAWRGQLSLFRDDNPADHAERMVQVFGISTPVPWKKVDDFALNETPFNNPKSMLRVLEDANRLTVETSDPKRRRNTYPDNRVISVTFH